MKKYIVIVAIALLTTACGKSNDPNNPATTDISQSHAKGAPSPGDKHVYANTVTGRDGIVYYGYRDNDDEIQFYSFVGENNGTYYALSKNGSLLLSCSGDCNVIKSDQFLAAPIRPRDLKEYLSHNGGSWSDDLHRVLVAALKANNVLEEYASTRTDLGDYTIAGGVMHDARSGSMKPMEPGNGSRIPDLPATGNGGGIS
ncbi:MAG: hypothetical protein ACYCZC_03310 [Acidithiobacillus sp.]